jgi:UDP-N-acetylglucosamine--N-acetylmuramyl-(pentapeptide) pyrophosphoryl-undecaprenol N-acetylglucosamine transferase
MKRILFTGGGSAGHVIPNIALIEELLSNGGADVCYMGTNGIEKRLIAAWKIPYYEIECPKLIRGGGWQAFKSNLHIPLDFLKAQKQALEGLRLLKP